MASVLLYNILYNIYYILLYILLTFFKNKKYSPVELDANFVI